MKLSSLTEWNVNMEFGENVQTDVDGGGERGKLHYDTFYVGQLNFITNKHKENNEYKTQT